MRPQLHAFLATLAVFAGCASGPTGGDRPSGREERLIELHAVVAGVDQNRRLLALQSNFGRIEVLTVGEEFADFEKLRAGDPVVVSYAEAIVWQVKPSGTGATGISARETVRNPKPGEAPGGAIERAITITATITAFDTAHGTVTLTAPDGRVQTIAAPRREDLERIRVGDLVDITRSELRSLALRKKETTRD